MVIPMDADLNHMQSVIEQIQTFKSGIRIDNRVQFVLDNNSRER